MYIIIKTTLFKLQVSTNKRLILNDFETQITKISSRVDEFDQKITETSGATSGRIHLYIHKSNFSSNSNKKINSVFQNLSKLMTNLKGEISEEFSNCHDMLNTSFSILANDIMCLILVRLVRMLNSSYFQPGFKMKSSNTNNFAISSCVTISSTILAVMCLVNGH